MSNLVNVMYISEVPNYTQGSHNRDCLYIYPCRRILPLQGACLGGMAAFVA